MSLYTQINWYYLWSGATALGIVLLFLGRGMRRTASGEAPAAIQFGFLALTVGIFGLIAVYASLALAMLVFVVVAGCVYVWERQIGKKRRPADAPVPDAIDLYAGLFPIIFVVFLVRSFVFEPFNIPSSSMRPGLEPGDFIAVNRYAYGLRVPVLNTVFIPVGSPQRGDVMVFHYPPDPNVDYIKRVIGVPGDVVAYQDKVLTINGKRIAQQALSTDTYLNDNNALDVRVVRRQKEWLDTHPHDIFIDDSQPSVSHLGVEGFPHREACTYGDDDRSFSCTVPAGNYFMMGDNRDNSKDGRYWGFVPEANIVGRASLVLFNLGKFSRSATVIH